MNHVTEEKIERGLGWITEKDRYRDQGTLKKYREIQANRKCEIERSRLTKNDIQRDQGLKKEIARWRKKETEIDGENITVRQRKKRQRDEEESDKERKRNGEERERKNEGWKRNIQIDRERNRQRDRERNIQRDRERNRQRDGEHKDRERELSLEPDSRQIPSTIPRVSIKSEQCVNTFGTEREKTLLKIIQNYRAQMSVCEKSVS